LKCFAIQKGLVSPNYWKSHCWEYNTNGKENKACNGTCRSPIEL